MKVLVINGSCLFVNSSANLCHLAYLQGLIDAGIDVSLLSASPQSYFTDSSMKIPDGVDCHHVQAISLYERLSLAKRKTARDQVNNKGARATATGGHATRLQVVFRSLKDGVRGLYGPHGKEKTFYTKSKNFTCDIDFDYVLSISHPPVSHLVAYKLLKCNRIKAKHWIQIWEDPWYADAYGFNARKRIFREERRLLYFADKVCYVSPLTLQNQQRLFPESAKKMFWKPLPAYYKDDTHTGKGLEKNVYGYFGDYVPAARDLEPFYQAAKNTGVEVRICGHPYGLFSATEQIHTYHRLPLAELKPIEDETSVLVFLCNRRGGQIPGKIYQYSATDKTILFILDGTEEEQTVLKDYFGKFNRYVFCQNTVEDIARAIHQIESGDVGNIRHTPLDDFEPKKIIESILNAGR